MRSIYELSRDDFVDYFLSINEKKFKANIIFDWLYKKRVSSFKDMTNLSNRVIDKLENDFTISKLEIVNKKSGKDVEKFLFRLYDNEYIEAVLMYHDYGISLCVSTEVGCNMGCAFCESGRLKKRRNLSVSEMVLQILMIESVINKRISHIVLMGIGEPFDNYDNVLKFINIINDDIGIGIGARHITISTCGIIPKIKEFTKEKLQVNLAISLHASNNELRSKIMPINKVYPLDELISVLKDYVDTTNRRLTFEYIMLDNINDKDVNAYELVNLLKGINCYVNLIPYNETENISFKRSKLVKINQFYDILKKNNINVTVRKEFGRVIDGACGQLRSHYMEDV